MPNGSTKHLVDLIQSLTKAEKRSFKLFARRNSGQDDLKYLRLFDFMEKYEQQYTDEEFTARHPEVLKNQVSNLKAHLYKQLLISLRLQQTALNKEIEIREMYDYATVLYNKGFYNQALRMLEKAGQQAERIHNYLLRLEVVEFEKTIESQYITRSLDTRAEDLKNFSTHLYENLEDQVYYSNLSLQLYALYLKVGFVRDKKDYQFVKEFFYSRLKEENHLPKNFNERLHLYSAYVWYNYIIQDFLMCFRYAKAWVDLFAEYPEMIAEKPEMFLKGHHNLLNALFHLRNYKRFNKRLEELKSWEIARNLNENVFILKSLYVYTNEINRYFLNGEFEKGLTVIPEIMQFVEEYESKLDSHRVLVFYYKIACLYFGSGENRMAIKYLNYIIQFREPALRQDIQSFARILNLIAHFEIGNDELVEYQIKSVYRFLLKLGDLQAVQVEILNFLRKLPILDPKELIRAFRVLHGKLTRISQTKYEQRPFLYLDIISWLESKIENRPVSEVIRSKFSRELETGQKHYFPRKTD